MPIKLPFASIAFVLLFAAAVVFVHANQTIAQQRRPSSRRVRPPVLVTPAKTVKQPSRTRAVVAQRVQLPVPVVVAAPQVNRQAPAVPTPVSPATTIAAPTSTQPGTPVPPLDIGGLKPPAVIPHQSPEEVVPAAGKPSRTSTPRRADAWRPIGELKLDTRLKGSLPRDHAVDFFGERVKDAAGEKLRDWPPTVTHWQAPQSYHRPLYFEQPALERRGHSRHPRLQPLFSGIRFFGTIPTLPVQILNKPPRSLVHD